MLRPILLSSVFLTLLSCGESPPNDFNQIVFNYQDSSVPPQYHRSYTIEIYKNGKGIFSVNSYGDTLHQEVLQIDAEKIKSLFESAQQLQAGGHKGAEAMSGSSMGYLELYQDEKQLYELSWTSRKDLKEQSVKVVERMEGLIKNFKGKTLPGKPTIPVLQRAELLKEQILTNQDSEKEAELLKALWQISRNVESSGLYLSVWDSTGQSVDINDRSQGDSIKLTLEAPHQEWALQLEYAPLRMENVSVLMRE